jgi:hypothetical protein
MGMLKAVSLERAKFLLDRQVAEGWLSDYDSETKHFVAAAIRDHAHSYLCIEHPIEELELRQVNPVKAAIQRMEIAPSGKLFVPDHDL